jgi:hypothetical protein
LLRQSRSVLISDTITISRIVLSIFHAEEKIAWHQPKPTQTES